MLFDTKTYSADVGEHKVEFEFDKSGVVVNRGRLYLDGKELGQRAVHWGESDLHGEMPDGRPFKGRVWLGLHRAAEVGRACARWGAHPAPGSRGLKGPRRAS